MQIMVDNVTKQKLIVSKGTGRMFSMEFPADSDTAELYGVVAFMKGELWKSLEAAKAEAEKAEVKEETITKEDIEKVTPIVTPEIVAE